MSKDYNLEKRLITFAVKVLTLVDRLPKSGGAIVLARQLSKSGSSPALNYGEAQAAESPRDFIHKMKVCLKELRESQICLKIIKQKPYLEQSLVSPVLLECGELVAIFVASVQTAQRNQSTIDDQKNT